MIESLATTDPFDDEEFNGLVIERRVPGPIIVFVNGQPLALNAINTQVRTYPRHPQYDHALVGIDDPKGPLPLFADPEFLGDLEASGIEALPYINPDAWTQAEYTRFNELNQ